MYLQAALIEVLVDVLPVLVYAFFFRMLISIVVSAFTRGG